MKNFSTTALFRQHAEWIPLVFILLGAFALRVYRLGTPAIWWDESLSVYRAARDLAMILSNVIVIQNIITYDTLPPLYFALLHFLVRAIGTTELALRFLSVAVNLVTIPLVYVLARRWLSVGAGLLGAALAALSPFYVAYAQQARPYALALLLSTLAIYALARAFPEKKPPIPRWTAVYVVAATAALYTHYYAIFLLPVHWLIIFILVRRRYFLHRWTLLPGAALALALPLVPLIRASMEGNAGSGPTFVPLDVILRDLLNSFSVGITLDLSQAIWIDLILLALFLVGVLATRKKAASIFLVSILLFPVLGVFAASFVRPLYQNSRYLISISPAFYLGVAAGIVALAQRWRVVGIAALGVFLIGAALSLSNLYTGYGTDDHRAWREYLHEHWRDGDLLILDSPHTEELFRYYAGDLGEPITLPILRADKIALPDADRAAVQQAYAQGERIWFLEMDVAFDDAEHRIERLLNENGVLLNLVDFSAASTELQLGLYVAQLPIVSISEIAHPLDIGFTGNMRLRGFDSPSTLAAGARNVVRLFWQVDERVGEDYAVSARLLDKTGQRVTQADAVPLGNEMGSSRWEPRMILIDEHELPIPPSVPAGTYDLEVVPYHAATGNALGEPVILGQVQVVPLANPAGIAGGNKRP